MDLDWIWQEASKNQFFQGGFVLMLIGAAGMWARSIPRAIKDWFLIRVSVTMHVTARDPIFVWMLRWISNHGYARDWARSLTPWTDKARRTYDDFSPRSAEDENEDQPVVLFTASPGTHYLLWRRRLVVVARRAMEAGEGKGMIQQYTSNFGPFATDETMTITVYARNRDLAKALIHEAAEEAWKESRKGTVPKVEVQTYEHTQHDWFRSNEQRCRPLGSVVLREGVMESLVTDVKTFLGRAKWYADRGIPYRRGYLLYGEPGSGKSSTVLALASHFNLTVCVLDITARGMDDQHLRKAFASLPAKAAVLIEDVDCFFKDRKTVDDKAEITFAGFLNSIDGVTGSEGRLLFLTTNHRDRLDPALIRPGRCDMSVSFDEPTKEQLARMWGRFFGSDGDWEDDNCVLFANRVPSTASMAAVQGHLIHYAHDRQAALDHADEISLADVTDSKLKQELLEQETLV